MHLVVVRYAFIGAALLFVFIFYTLRSHQWLDQTWRIPVGSAYSPPPKVDQQWSWADRKAHFPLEGLVPLPSRRPKQLPKIQHAFGPETLAEKSQRQERQAFVKEVFKRNWQSYRKKAWMYDELAPLSGKGQNNFGGWAATLVDAMDTLWIMDMKDEFEEAVAAAVQIDFTTSTDETINVFETTIRYLGGFLSAYDLSGNVELLDKAVEIGEMLLVPFDTPNHMPITRWDWQKAKNGTSMQEASDWMLLAEIGSLSMEFTRLSQLTGDFRWYDAVNRITRWFEGQQGQTQLPGMWPVVVNAKDKDMTSDNTFTLGGMSDSVYEYFPKMYVLLGGLEPVYQKLYKKSMKTAKKYLFFRPMTPKGHNVLMAGDAKVEKDDGKVVLSARFQHLTCFAGGMLALGQRLFGGYEHMDMATKITKGCIWAYNATSVGVMPEIAEFVPCPTGHACPWDSEAWRTAVLEHNSRSASDLTLDHLIADKHLPEGYASITDGRYILRPEALESVFYMYRVTGNRAYMDSAWQMFNAIEQLTKTELANAAINDIRTVGEDGLPPKQDRMESFWLAETIKYAYLIFSEPDLISLDDYVFNTEAHPFNIPK